MWIVRLALRRPYTFVVAAILLLLLTPFVLLRTPTDILPNIDIPVVSVIWPYAGLDAQEMEQRIIYGCEQLVSTTVNNIEHIESTSYNGIGIIKVKSFSSRLCQFCDSSVIFINTKVFFTCLMRCQSLPLYAIMTIIYESSMALILESATVIFLFPQFFCRR